MKLDIVCVVWGAKYVNMMLDYCFASLLAPGNVPDWPYQAETLFHLYTTATDAKTIQEHRYFQQLAQYIDIQFHIDFANEAQADSNGDYDLMNLGNQLGVRGANQRHAAFMYIAPDHVFATDCFTTIADWVQSGVELIMTLTPRVDIGCVGELDTMRTAHCLTLSPDVAMDLLMTYLNPQFKTQIWDADVFQLWCGQAYGFVDANALMIRAYNLHPLFMLHPPPYEIPGATMDFDYLASYNHQLDKVRIAQDNQLFILSLTAPEHSLLKDGVVKGNLSLPYRQLWLDSFYRTATVDIHRYCFQHPIVLKGTGEKSLCEQVNPESASAIEAMAAFQSVEQAWLEDQHSQVLAIYQRHQDLLTHHLPEVFQQACAEYARLSGAAMVAAG